MLTAPQHPHISAAVKHTRGWVTLLSIIVATCCLSQMLIYGFVRFTEIRFTEVSTPTPYGERSLQVVVPTEAGPAEASEAVGGVRSKAIAQGREVGPTRIQSGADSAMARISVFATSAGALCCVLLAMMTALGTVIAGGGNVPGVERTVTATTWAVLLGLLCLPWSNVFPGLRIPGVFSDYSRLCAVADKIPGSVSPTVAFFQWILMPLAAATVSMVVLGMFRSGVERGVIVTSVNQFDAAIEREMSELAKRGVVAAGTMRSLGAMNRAVGMANAGGPGAVAGQPSSPMPAVMPVPGMATSPGVRPGYQAVGVEAALDQAANMAASLVREAQPSSATGGRSVVDGNYRRLI
jgi:hypothetical protein